MSDLELWKQRASTAGTVIVECANAQAVATYMKELCLRLARQDARMDLISGTPAEALLVALPEDKRHCEGGLPAPLAHMIQHELKDVAHCVHHNLRAHAGGMDIGLARVSLLVADTGSCVLDATDEEIRLATMLPDISLLLADPAAIVSDLDAARTATAALLEHESPRHVSFITGPSRTADIERVLTLGVHGPLELHVLLVPQNVWAGTEDALRQ